MFLRPLALVGVMFLFGALFVLVDKWVLIPGIICIFLNLPARGRRKYLGITLIFFLMGLSLSFYKNEEFNASKTYSESRTDITLSGEIYKKEFKNEKHRIYLKNAYSKDNTSLGRVIAYMDKEGPGIGSLVKVSGQVIPAMTVENEGGFDGMKYLKSQGISLSLGSAQVKVLREPVFPVGDYFYRLREEIKGFFEDNLPRVESGLLSAMLLGDKTSMDENASDIFSKAGLSHILAISGMHLSIVGMGVYRILRRFRLSFLISGLVSGIAVLLYGLLTGNPVSLIRAMGMFILMVTAAILGRDYDMLNGLFLMLIIMLFLNPFYVLDAGFVLSFVAILGICICAGPMEEAYKRHCRDNWDGNKLSDTYVSYKPSFKERVLGNLISGVGIALFTYPVVAFYFNRIPLYTIFLNLILLPFLGILIICGLLSGLFTFVPTLYICHFILYYYEMAAVFVNKLPLSFLAIATPNGWAMVLYYGLLISGVRFINGDFSGSLYGKIKRGMVLIPMSLVLVLFLYVPGPSGFRIDMLSVGQGDGIYLESEEGVRFFVDGGSSSKDEIWRYTISKYFGAMGIEGIDYWFITHMDSDHISGVMEMLREGFRVEKICIPKAVEKTEDFPVLKRLCRENKSLLAFVKEGDRILTETMEIRVLFPGYPSKFQGANENSLCFLLNYGDFSAVFTGDMGSKQEEALVGNKYLKEAKARGGIEILKAAHHGSNSSNSGEWLDFLEPKGVIISAGKNNRYGHPGKEAIGRMEDRGIEWFCTITMGRIRVKWEDECLNIEGFVGGGK